MKVLIDLSRSFRQMSSFGFDTIRVFANDASEMKKLAARDFEDLLQVSIWSYNALTLLTLQQCSIPVFDGLLPEPHNKRVMTLLYRTAEWHALAKLRMHTDATLDYMDQTTQEFGKLMRQFRDISNANFATVELEREKTARYRRNAEKAGAPGKSDVPKETGKKPKALNLNTYKYHAMGDYVPFIRHFGPTDSYSTQLVRETTSQASHPLIYPRAS